MKSILNLFHDNGQGVLLSVLALIIFGTINIYSASYVASGSGMFIKQAIWAVLGCGVMYFFSKVNYWRTEKIGMILTVIAIILCILVRLTGEEINGARRWLDLGFVQFQPSEIAKIASACLAASYIGRTLRSGSPISLVNVELLLIIVMGGFVLIQPDMGTAAIVIGIGVALYVIAGLTAKQVRLLIGAAMASAVVFIMMAPYRLVRVMSWLGMVEDAQGTDYQADQAEMVIGSGGLGGAGWGGGLSKYSYLPESHTDFAFAVFCEEWGFIGTVRCIVLPFVLFSHHGFRIAKQTDDYYGKMLAFGMTLLISGQALSNMLMVMGSLPVIGVPLPFISYGGTSLVINMMCVGLLLSIHRKNKSLARAKMKRAQAQESKQQAAGEQKE